MPASKIPLIASMRRLKKADAHVVKALVELRKAEMAGPEGRASKLASNARKSLIELLAYLRQLKS
jgi:hypothetical protein